jgi:hydrogenase maturation protein HypF
VALALSVMQQMYAFQPVRVVCDAHPGYRARRWADEQALATETVLHHHAHAAACLAENGWPLDGGDVIALTLDGIGMGDNGALWGGECLRVNYLTASISVGLRWRCRRRSGGRSAVAQFTRTLPGVCAGLAAAPETHAVQAQNWPLLATAISRGINTPLASSCGRLFDAVACALDSRQKSRAMKVKLPVGWKRWLPDAGVAHPVTLPVINGNLALSVFWQQWLDWQAEPCERAWAFHDALAKGLAELAASTPGVSTVCCSGGVLHNRLLRARLRHYLSDFTLLLPCHLPAGDGAISFGQVVAAARSCSQRT